MRTLSLLFKFAMKHLNVGMAFQG